MKSVMRGKHSGESTVAAVTASGGGLFSGGNLYKTHSWNGTGIGCHKLRAELRAELSDTLLDRHMTTGTKKDHLHFVGTMSRRSSTNTELCAPRPKPMNVRQRRSDPMFSVSKSQEIDTGNFQSDLGIAWLD